MTQLIRINGQRVHGGATVRIGVQRDNDVRRIVFQSVPTIGDAQTVSLLWVAGDVGDVITLTLTPDGYAWDILNSITQHADRAISAYLRVDAPDGKLWHTESFRIACADLPDINKTVTPPTVTAIDQMLAAIATHSADMAAQERRVEDMVTEGGSQLAEVERIAGEVADDAQGVEADKTATHGYMVRSEDAAEDAEDSADDAAEQAQIAQNNILNGVSTHNASPAAHDDIRDDARRIEAIARGRATAYVFDTYADMLAWLADPAHTEGLVRGDNLYIRDTGVKDYWWDGDAPQELEAEAPDLTDYYTRSQVDALLPIYLSESAYAALVAAGTTEAGRVYYPVPDDQWEVS